MTGQDYLFAWAVVVAWTVFCIGAALYIETLTRRN
jgi:hypothetical protein